MANRLAQEKSPYLLQHAHNPVDWYPWGTEAFQKARQEDKPIFLSIGYSTCHWCHVMEKESFDDPDVAALLNDAFVCVKVDREERPDVDNIYMTVCQMMTGSGGWPLTIIMTPDGKPFFAATYIPKNSRFGRSGMTELVPRIQEIWNTRREDVYRSAEEITVALQKATQAESTVELNESALKLAYRQLSQSFDDRFGGFGSSPKFPTPHQQYFLLRYWKRFGEERALQMVEKTLQEMRLGGIYDQVGFGFHRYSTDPYWLVPHFEKMLYDQALISLAYLETYQLTRKEEYRKVAEEIFRYVLRDMTSPEGGFYSAEDADSEGEEGKFYLWTETEVRRILGAEGDFAIRIWNMDPRGNFVDPVNGNRDGGNILHFRRPPDLEEEIRLDSIREKLFQEREKRIHPLKDDKILCDWNGLMIAALARGAQVLEKPEYAAVAEKAVDFILRVLRRPDGSLIHRYRHRDASLPAHLDDYAFLTWGLLELYEATFKAEYLRSAMNLTDYLIQHFWDSKAGGFFFTADNAENLLIRTKDVYDGAVPSGNSVALWNLLRLFQITGKGEYEEKAAGIVKAFSASIVGAPMAYTLFLCALDLAFGPGYQVIISGDPEGKDTQAMISALRKRFLPNKVVLLRTSDLFPIAPYIEKQKPIDGAATAYICRNHVCNQPVTNVEQMLSCLA